MIVLFLPKIFSLMVVIDTASRQYEVF